jgi:hypothetical protein
MPSTPAEKTPTAVATSAEGDLPPAAQQVAPPADAPTREEIAAEWNTYRATRLLIVGGAPAVAPQGAVPASHPMLQEWLDDGSVERIAP